MRLRSGFRTPSKLLLPTENSAMDTTDKMSDSGDADVHPKKAVHVRYRTAAFKTHICLVLHVVCFFMQVSIVAFKTRKLGIDAVGLGSLDTTFAILQLVGGPIFGRFGDLFGGRAAMILALSCASLCYFLTGISSNYTLLFMSRLPAIFMHANQASQMVITDISDGEGRADALGKLGVSFGIGMVIGPFLGGQLTKHLGEEAAAYTASIIAAAATVFAWYNIPKNTKKSTHSVEKSDKATAMFSLAKWRELLKQPGVFMLLIVKGITGLPFGAFQTMSTLIFIEQFGLEPQQCGMVLSYIGLVLMAIQGFGIGILTKRYSETSLIKWSNFILIWSWLMFAFLQNIWQFCLIMIPQAFGLAMQNVVISSVLTKTVAQSDTGALLGVSAAVHSVVRTVSPTLGGFMLTNLGFPSFGFTGSIVSVFMTLYLFAELRE